MSYDAGSHTMRLLNGYLYIGTTKAMGAAIVTSTEPLPELIKALGRELDVGNLRTREMKNANKRIARAAAKAVAEGWKSRLPNPGHAKYRAGAGRYSGQLGPLLANIDDMTEGTTDRVISFINESRLYHKAKHWARVNYGSEGAGGVPPGRFTDAARFEITLYKTPLLTLHDPTPARPTSHLPKQYYILGTGEARQMHVVPGRGKPARVNEGNGTRAARFTDLGLEAVAERFPRVYLDVFKKYIKKNETRTRKRNPNLPMDLRADRMGRFYVNGKVIR